MAWTPELRKKYNERQKEKLRLGLILSPTQQRAQNRARMEKLLHPTLRRPTIEAMFQGEKKEPLVVTRHNAMKYVRLLCDKSPKLAALADAWDKLPESKQKTTSLDMLCEKVELPVPEFIALVAPRAYEMGHKLAKLFVGLAQPELARVAIAAAKDKKNGFKDRQMMLQAGGTAPSPQGINVAIQNTQITTTDMPDFDGQTIDLAEAVRGD